MSIRSVEDVIVVGHAFASLGWAVIEQLDSLDAGDTPENNPSSFNKNALENYIRPFLEMLRDDFNLDIESYQWWEDDDDY